jgi:integrating conjugative element protein (TIGR03759 family)
MIKYSSLTLSLLLGQQAIAGLSIPHIINQPIHPVNNALTQAGLAQFQDEVIEEKNFELNENQLHEAKVWGLNELEEKRHVQLMQSRSAIYYKNLRLTPVDILGLNARDDTERAHFAELAAQHEAQKVAQNIAWNNAFYKAYNELFKEVPVIGDFDPAPYSPYAHQPLELKSGETLYLFVQNDDAITTILLQLIDVIARTPNTRLNILFLNMDMDAIELWANKQQIPMHLVNSEQISLNPGDEQFAHLALKQKQPPLLLISQGKTSQVINLGRF